MAKVATTMRPFMHIKNKKAMLYSIILEARGKIQGVTSKEASITHATA